MIYFGDCALDTQNYVLDRGDQSIRLQRKPFQVLLYLLEHRDRIVSKQELSQQLWPGKSCSNATLESTMKTVRQALGDSGHTQRYIQTFRGSGYRFVAIVIEDEAPLSSHTFTSELAQDSAQAASLLPSSKVEQKTQSIKNAKILVVDDDPNIVEILYHYLSEEGYDVLTTNDGAEAVDIASNERPDMILLDIHMPHVSGFEVLHAIKTRSINSRVILFSGEYTDTDTAVNSIKSGADDFFTKPFKKEQVLRKVKKNLILDNAIIELLASSSNPSLGLMILSS